MGGVPEGLEELIDRMVEANQAGYTPIVLDEYGADNLVLFGGSLKQTGSTANLYDIINGSANWADDEFVHTSGNIGVMPLPPMSTAQSDQYTILGTFGHGFAFSADVTEKEEQMIYQFIETLWSDGFMIEYNIEYGYVPAMSVESATGGDPLFLEIVQINNQATGVFPDLRSNASLALSDYLEEIMIVLTELMNGNLSVYDVVEYLQEYDETGVSRYD